MATSYESNLSCAICLELYDDPRVLPCGHSYCLKCLLKLSKKRSNRGVMTCPLCQAESSCKDGGRTSYTKNCELNSLVQSFIVQKKSGKTHDRSGEGNVCGICDAQKPAQRACVECDLMYCEKCFVTRHPMSRKLRNHKIVDVDGNFSHKKQKKNDDRNMYCNDCDILITVADINSHSKHEVVSLDKARSIFKVKLEEAMSNIDLMQPTLQSSFHKSKKKLVVVESIFENIELDVKNKKEEVLSKLKAEVKEAESAIGHMMSVISTHRKVQSQADTISFIEECQNIFRSTSLKQDYSNVRLQLDKIYSLTCKNEAVIKEIGNLELCAGAVQQRLQFCYQQLAGNNICISRDGRKIAHASHALLHFGGYYPRSMNQIRTSNLILGSLRMTSGCFYWEVETPQATGEDCKFGLGVTSSATPADCDLGRDVSSCLVLLDCGKSPMTMEMWSAGLYLHKENCEVATGQSTHRYGLLLDIHNHSLSVIHVKGAKIIHTITNIDTSHGVTPVFAVYGPIGALRLLEPTEIQRSPLLPVYTYVV